MKKLAFLFVFALIAFLPSCKKCTTCTLQCRNCTQNAYISTYCRNDYYSDAEFLSAVSQAQLNGSSCVIANETDKLCRSGFFHRTILSEEVSERESEGWECE